jgi:diadenylate cyclase
MTWMERLTVPGFGGMVEIIILSILFYFVIRFFRGTPGAHVLFGLIGLITALIVVTRVAELEALNWMLRQLSVYVALALLVLFQPEVRRVLAELGRRHFVWEETDAQHLCNQIVRAVEELARQRIGALIAIERDIGTRAVQDTGIQLDARVSAELLVTLFTPRTPLHDGGVVLSGSRVVAAGCMFPLTQRLDIGHELGTRHRAAIGLSEETDAVCLVVSEGNGTISFCIRGRMSRNLDGAGLRKLMLGVLVRPRREALWSRLWRFGRRGADGSGPEREMADVAEKGTERAGHG